METAVVATLRHFQGGEHVLRGIHGARVLQDVCDRWNRERRPCPEPLTPCAADKLTQSSRRKFLTNFTP